jgi:hypothetical protein
VKQEDADTTCNDDTTTAESQSCGGESIAQQEDTVAQSQDYVRPPHGVVQLQPNVSSIPTEEDNVGQLSVIKKQHTIGDGLHNNTNIESQQSTQDCNVESIEEDGGGQLQVVNDSLLVKNKSLEDPVDYTAHLAQHETTHPTMAQQEIKKPILDQLDQTRKSRFPSLPMSLGSSLPNPPLLRPLPSLPSPTSPNDPPVLPFTAFSLPTSPSHKRFVPVVQQPTTHSAIGPTVFAPITPATAPIAGTPLATPRPITPATASSTTAPRSVTPATTTSRPQIWANSSNIAPGIVSTAFTPPNLFGADTGSLPYLPVFSTQKKDDL